jgi:polyisoprenoid-binding protein YceI
VGHWRPDSLFDGIDVRMDAGSIDTNLSARDEDLRSGRLFAVASFPISVPSIASRR